MSWLLSRRSSFQPTAQAAVCVGHPFSSGLTVEQPQPPGQGTGAVKIAGLCCSFDGRWVARLPREVKIPTAPTGTLVADI